MRFLLALALVFSTLALAEEKGKVVFDFETGDLQGWRVVEGKFDYLVSDREVFHNRYPDQPGNKFNKTGKYYLSTVEQQPGMPSNDRMTGIVESPSFVIEGDKITFRMAGGNLPNSYLALCVEEADGTVTEQRKVRGSFTEVLADGEWDVTSFIGKTAFFRIVDHETGGWGYVAADQLEVVGKLNDEATARRFEQLEKRRKKELIETFIRNINIGGLRATIADLEERYGEAYTSGKEFLVKLNDLEEKTQVPDFEPTEAFTVDAESLKREIVFSNPILRRAPICFVMRKPYESKYHAIDTLFNSDEYHPDYHRPHKEFFSPGSALKLFDPATGNVTTLLETADGVIRDPDVYFDGSKILFAMRNNRDEDYKIWEMQLKKDGEIYSSDGLKQLTFARDVADFDPLYLADDTIVFSSTREPKYNMCSRDIGANLYRMESDGANIVQITKNTLFDHNAEQLPDGRIMYHRWEYVDRNFGDAHGVWTVNPDGTNQSIYWGNNTAVPGAVYNPRLIPGTSLILCVFGPHHFLENGALAIVDRRIGLDGKKPVLRTWPKEHLDDIPEQSGFDCDHSEDKVPLKYEDPFPLDDKYFLCSRMIERNGPMGIYLVDLFGNETLLYRESFGCYDPMPLVARQRPQLTPERRDFAENGEGTLFLANVYEGTPMKDVPFGSIKTLRIVESPEKRHWSAGQWFGQGYTAPGMNWHSLENKRILGTVPVEADGSASFIVPADTFFYIQALDADNKMVQSMRSGTILQSGEVVGCVGCHEDRLNTPNVDFRNTMATKRAPSRLTEWYGSPRMFGYLKEVQPVFDKHCVSCHDFGQPAGEKLLLAGDADVVFNVSYVELWRKGYVGAIGAGPAELQSAYSWGAYRSRLIRELEKPTVKEHADLKLDKEDWDRLMTWTDLNGVYYSDYSCTFPEHLAGRCPLNPEQVTRLSQLTGVDFYRQISFASYKGPYISFDRPELSPCLARIADKDSVEYREALEIIRKGAETLKQFPQCGIDGFVRCEADQAREKKYEFRKNEERLNRAAIRNGEKRYDKE